MEGVGWIAAGVAHEFANLLGTIQGDIGIMLLRGSISKRVVVRTTLSREVTPVRGNLVQIQLVVMNLITNAIEAFGEKQGVVTVSTDRVRFGAGLGAMTWANVDDGDYVRLKARGRWPWYGRRETPGQRLGAFCRSQDHTIASRRHQRREHAAGTGYL